MTSMKTIAQGHHNGTHRILEVGTLYYHFQQKNCIYTQLDSHVILLVKSSYHHHIKTYSALITVKWPSAHYNSQ